MSLIILSYFRCSLLEDFISFRERLYVDFALHWPNQYTKTKRQLEYNTLYFNQKSSLILFSILKVD
ncbi:hypothetical protein CH365_09150 [Leptospira neocaledonica]|uniref:Uncharacterized protein n=1 Tax=Leptospira neocaledonica TaxID=2023192 RepID=A0A2N0A0D8_9LEPT|nr:hypothetical protein CH365_09150 [Leptospira neocaledonica]